MTTTPITSATAGIEERRWTPAQQAAIASRDRLLVAAAAGSGKTSVLTELVVQALVAREVTPAQVCAVTFTEKAAQEMRARIGRRLAELDERSLLEELELARIGTIHGLCAAVLRRHGVAVGVDPAAGVLDDAQHAWLLRQSIEAACAEHAGDADVHWLRARMGDDRIHATLQGLHRLAAAGSRETDLLPAEQASAIVDASTGEIVVSERSAVRSYVAMARLWEAFQRQRSSRVRELGRLAFDDLEQLAVQAVRHDEVRSALRAQWSLVLVDEFQDTNERQCELLDAIGGDRLFMVGDEWQSIYGFRGADVAVFRQRRAELGRSVLPMRDNFRSDGPVLDLINRAFAHEDVFGGRYEPVQAGTAAQRSASSPAVELLVVPRRPVDGYDVDEWSELVGASGREREAARVAERVAELVESGVAPGSIAILYATSTGAKAYEAALRSWSIPTLRAASGGYYDQRDVQDAIAVLRATRNTADDHALLQVLAGPLGMLEWHELDELVQDSRARRRSLHDAAADSQLGGARAVISTIDELGALAVASGIVDVVARVVSHPQLELGAARDRDGALRVANLRRLVELAASARGVGVDDVTSFLEFVEAQQRDARVGEASIADEQVGAVRLMTVHAAKGLEFPHVFVVESAATGIGRGGSTPAPLIDADGAMHMAVPARDGRCHRSARHDDLHQQQLAVQAQERLRLWYVAMTRACERLYVSGAWDFTPTAKGLARSVPGALRWIQRSLDLPDDLGGPGRSFQAADDLVRVDTRPARREPRPVWHAPRAQDALRAPLALPPAGAAARDAIGVDGDRRRLASALREQLKRDRADDWQLLEGTRVHDGVARLIDAARSGVDSSALLDPERGPWLTRPIRERLEPVVAAAVFQRLIALGARSEVPYLARRGDALPSRLGAGVQVAARHQDVDSGRFDALAILPDGSWWIVDWKLSLPADDDAAWSSHGLQLVRYADAAQRAGARGVVVTLASITNPSCHHTWRVIDASSADGSRAVATPVPCQLP